MEPSRDGPEGFHCPNCRYLELKNGSGFWACQNLCIRELDEEEAAAKSDGAPSEGQQPG